MLGDLHNLQANIEQNLSELQVGHCMIDTDGL
jgi:hypothetical protein